MVSREKKTLEGDAIHMWQMVEHREWKPAL